MTDRAIASLEDLRERLGVVSPRDDDVLRRLLASATAVAERLVGRDLLRATLAVEPEIIGRTSQTIVLPLTPVESVTAVKHRWDETTAWADAELLVAGTDYALADAKWGRIEKLDGWWPPSLAGRLVRVEFVGGYADLLADTVPETAVAAPADLQEAVIAEAARQYTLRGKGAIGSVSLGGGGSADLSRKDPVPELVAICTAMRRRVH